MLMLERLFVKTLINLNHVRGWQVGDDPTHPQTPTRELVEVVFGLRRFTDAKGLYIAAKAGDNVTPRKEQSDSPQLQTAEDWLLESSSCGDSRSF
jgi:hypothetical protein